MHSGDGKSRVGRRVEDAGTGLASDILTAQPCDGSLQLVDWREKCRLATNQVAKRGWSHLASLSIGRCRQRLGLEPKNMSLAPCGLLRTA